MQSLDSLRQRPRSSIVQHRAEDVGLTLPGCINSASTFLQGHFLRLRTLSEVCIQSYCSRAALFCRSAGLRLYVEELPLPPTLVGSDEEEGAEGADDGPEQLAADGTSDAAGATQMPVDGRSVKEGGAAPMEVDAAPSGMRSQALTGSEGGDAANGVAAVWSAAAAAAVPTAGGPVTSQPAAAERPAAADSAHPAAVTASDASLEAPSAAGAAKARSATVAAAAAEAQTAAAALRAQQSGSASEAVSDDDLLGSEVGFVAG